MPRNPALTAPQAWSTDRRTASPWVRRDPRTNGPDVSTNHQLAALLIFGYWLVHENVALINSEALGGYQFWLVVSATKLLVPVVILFLAGIPFFGSGAKITAYFVTFAGLIAWAAVPTVMSGDPLRWVKILPRVLFAFSTFALFVREPRTIGTYTKCLITYVLFALAGYLLAYITGSYSTPTIFAVPGAGEWEMAGPLGLFGNVTNRMSFIDMGIELPVMRLSGFWLEPSQAASASIAAYYLGRFITRHNGSIFWSLASYFCLATGLLAMSNSGYLALGLAVITGVLLGNSKRNLVVRALYIFAAATMIVIALGGRSYVSQNMSDSPVALAVTGVRYGNDRTAYDPSGGRLDSLQASLATATDYPLGVGIQDDGFTNATIWGNAPVLWLAWAGLPGLFLLIARETALFSVARHLIKNRPEMLLVVQALVAVMGQELTYGSWMNPNYFVPAAMILAVANLQADSNPSHAQPPIRRMARA